MAFAASAGADTLMTESRMPHHHNIPLHDADGQVLSIPAFLGEDGKPQEPKAPPYSVAQTCGKCHEYGLVSQGWHFNENNSNVKPGRPGEPWLLTDAATRTQIPVSYRGWPGTFKPAELGLSDHDFLTNVASFLPGGGVGEPAKSDTNSSAGRMQITGTMEIDCLICHQTDGRYNHEARAAALKGENFRWAPTIAAGLGSFDGFRSAGSIADRWRPGKPVPAMPGIKYDRAKFDADNNVNFPVANRVPPENCYFCHSSQSAAPDARWHTDQDIHLRAGLLCTDCHRNGLDHQMVRGYEGESKDRSISDGMVALRAKFLQRDNSALSNDDAQKLARQQLESETSEVDTLTCSGCHNSGRLGSPRLVHKGLPPIHFEKLTCTACHSGPVAGPQPEIVQTALAHRLGLPSVMRGRNTAPIIVEPVFLNGSDGRIAPFKMVWPSYWARLKAGKLTPLLAADDAKSVTLPKPTAEDAARDPFNSKPLTDTQIQRGLESLAGENSQGEPAFIAAGKMYRLDKGRLVAEESAAAKPYAWALAHDVRPAREALGAKGCADCHTADSPMFFATIAARGPVELDKGLSKKLWELRGDNKFWIRTFAFTFVFRPLLKTILLVAALVVAAVIAATIINRLRR